MAAIAPGNLTVAASTVAVYCGRFAAGTVPNWFGAGISVYGLSPNSYLLGWPHAYTAATIATYQYSLNGGGTWIDVAVPYVYVTGRTASSTDDVRVRAVDSNGLVSAVLSKAVVLPDSGAPTWLIKTIGSAVAGFPAPDYATTAAWCAAGPTLAGGSSLVSANVGLLGLVLPGELNGQCEMVGMSTSAAAFRMLSAHPGASFVDNALRRFNPLRYNAAVGAALRYASVGRGQCVGLHEANSKITRLQLVTPGAGTNHGGWTIHSSAPGGNCLVEQCIVSGGDYQHTLSMNYGPHIVRNTVVDCIRTGTPLDGNPMASIGEENNGCLHYGVLFVCSQTQSPLATIARTNDVVFANTAFANVAAVQDLTSGQVPGPTHTNCASDAASRPTGVMAAAYDASTGMGFESVTYASRDFRLRSTSALRGAGAADPTNLPVDITGAARPLSGAIDIGPWQYSI